MARGNTPDATHGKSRTYGGGRDKEAYADKLERKLGPDKVKPDTRNKDQGR